jgi:glycosyltransferase involved in cell wall biosynthesis
MPRPFVSVLIDTYNHERFIEEAVVSVLGQDFAASEREIIVVDDGSTDRTPEILRKFEPKLRVVRKANGGQASAFNAGIPECRGEVVAFLDGDDWWVPGKLTAVTEALSGDAGIGLVGNGITEVYQDGREHTELLREVPRFRIASEEGARAFRLRKSFLGTSRMTYRASVLRSVGQVPEDLVFEADEYVFTIAAVLGDVLILREPLTFYRLHDANAFQIANGTRQALQRKMKVLDCLAESLKGRLQQEGVPEGIARIIVESVETEADIVRLTSEGGLPWATIWAELRNYRIAHRNASAAHWLFKFLSLLPALVLPPRVYYALRQRFSANGPYRKFRERWLPFPQPTHVDRYRTTRP